MATGERFFEEQTEASAVKTRIIGNFFSSWATIVLPTAKAKGQKIAYIDLYCGPGRYGDNQRSTPLVVLEKAIAKQEFAANLVAIFNDENPAFVEKLKTEVAQLPGIEKLANKPVFMNTSIGSETEKYFLETTLVPTFTFIDPFGYTGLTLNLIRGVTKSWGSDCMFFFNYARINRALSAGVFRAPMSALFGEQRTETLERQLTTIEANTKLTPYRREELIIDTLSNAMKELKMHVRPFRFRKENRTGHNLVFVTKSPKGYEVMKNVMAKQSNVQRGGGIIEFTFSDTPIVETSMLMNFEFEQLKASLSERFKGQTLTMRRIYEEHHLGTDYIERNYKDALNSLEAEKKIRALPAAANRPAPKGKVTFGPEVRVFFP